jgi:large subunit ribosomal protein L29
METNEIRALSAEEIRTKIAETREELMKLRFQQVTGQLTDTSRLRTLRRTVARMETILTQMEQANQQEGVG